MHLKLNAIMHGLPSTESHAPEQEVAPAWQPLQANDCRVMAILWFQSSDQNAGHSCNAWTVLRHNLHCLPKDVSALCSQLSTHCYMLS